MILLINMDKHSESDSELLDISDSECHTIQELTEACVQSGVPFSGVIQIPQRPNKSSNGGTPNPESNQVDFSSIAENQNHGQVSGSQKINGKLSKKVTTLLEGEPTNNQVDLTLDRSTERSVSMTKALAVETGGLSRVSKNLNVSPVKKRKQSVREENRLKRMKGDAYVGFSAVVDPVTGRRRTPQNILRKPKEMGKPCKSSQCSKSQNRNCENFNEESRQIIFNEFWTSLSWNAKQAYVRTLVDQTAPRRCTAKDSASRRNGTFLYHLKVNGVRRQVCKSMFLSTLGIGPRQLRGWLSKSNSQESKRIIPSHRKGGDIKFAKDFLTSLAKMPSHYCRAKTKKVYLEPIFRTKTQVYDIYKQKCVEENVNFIVPSSFTNLVDKMNIGIFQPKKDQCDICCSKEAGNIKSEEEFHLHIQRKNAARNEKTLDKESAVTGNVHTLTMDVQKVLLSPLLNASALYYKTKLMIHNFTVFDLATRKTTCYLWEESQADLVASVFATCLLSFLEDNYQDDLNIIIFSDGCTSQNRNAILSNALLHHAVKKKKTIIQKYLEKGHTQMEVDSVHSHIENNLKGRSIYLPSDYVDICKNARKDYGGYGVREMKYGDFLDFTVNRPYKSIRPGSKKSDPHVTDLRQIKYNPDGTMNYKINHTDNWLQYPLRPRVDPTTNFPKLYNSRLLISKRKYDDLQDLLHVLPESAHEFYKSLPH